MCSHRHEQPTPAPKPAEELYAEAQRRKTNKARLQRMREQITDAAFEPIVIKENKKQEPGTGIEFQDKYMR
jgi:hypothetical protein